MKRVHKGVLLSVGALILLAVLFRFLPPGIYQLPLFLAAIVAFCFTFNHFIRRS